jgi:hypothetical protein
MRLRGLLFPSKGLHLFFILRLGPRFAWILHRTSRLRTRLDLRYRSHWFHAPQDRNVRLPEHVFDFRLF